MTDKSNGKMYVGSAYGDYGIWSRWETFQFSLLEFYSMKIDNQVVINREQYWKEVLCTCWFGYNLN